VRTSRGRATHISHCRWCRPRAGLHVDVDLVDGDASAPTNCAPAVSRQLRPRVPEAPHPERPSRASRSGCLRNHAQPVSRAPCGRRSSPCVRSAEARQRSTHLPSSTLTLGRLSCGHDTLRHARPWSSISEVRSQHSGDRDALCSFRASRGMLSIVGMTSLRTSRPELQPLRPQRLMALLPREPRESLTSEAI